MRRPRKVSGWWALTAMLLLIGFTIASAEAIKVPEPRVVTEVVTEVVVLEVVKPMLTREEVTEYVRGLRNSGSFNTVLRFYDGFVGDSDLCWSILAAADLYNIPINTLFALIWAESGFDPNAVNGTGNRDGTNDKGLMQLNSKYFPGIDRLDPEVNLAHGSQHLRYKFEKYGTWDEAVMYYNGFSQKAVEHQSRVLAKERELDRLFHTEGP